MNRLVEMYVVAELSTTLSISFSLLYIWKQCVNLVTRVGVGGMAMETLLGRPRRIRRI
jgi:hypothetical protein